MMRPAAIIWHTIFAFAIIGGVISAINQWTLIDCRRHAGKVEYGLWTECFMKTPGEYQR